MEISTKRAVTNVAAGAVLGGVAGGIAGKGKPLMIGLGLATGVVASGAQTFIEAKLGPTELAWGGSILGGAVAGAVLLRGIPVSAKFSPTGRTLTGAGVGALLALMAFKTEFSIMALIGVILLIGIVKKNAIMMIDFALEAERSRGLSSVDAIYEACLLRFRPIMMTTMAALLGALPLAIGFGAGAELRRPLGITIIGGLLVSQLLTLITTPVIYLYMDRFRRRSPHEAQLSRAGGSAAAEPAA